LNGVFIHPALNVLAATFHHYDAGVAKLLDVMGNRGRSDVQFFPQLADVPSGLFDGGSSFPRRADRKEAQKYRQSMRVCEGFEHLGVPTQIRCFIVRHISMYRTFPPRVKNFFSPVRLPDL
jgi:hypothetical protein